MPEDKPPPLDLAPLHHGCGPQGVGTDVERVWKKDLREIAPSGSKGDPVANNAFSRDGFQHSPPPGLFLQARAELARAAHHRAGLRARASLVTAVYRPCMHASGRVHASRRVHASPWLAYLLAD